MSGVVTDHALLRYLERIKGYDFSDEVEELSRLVGNIREGVVIGRACRLEVKNGCVVTVKPFGRDAQALAPRRAPVVRP
jgi:hypothetical protein